MILRIGKRMLYTQQYSMYLRRSFWHVGDRVFGDGEHLEDVASESALHIVQVDLRKFGAHDLLGSIVDETIELAVPAVRD